MNAAVPSIDFFSAEVLAGMRSAAPDVVAALVYGSNMLLRGLSALPNRFSAR